MLIATYGNFREGEALSYYLDFLRKNGETEIVELSRLKLFVVGMAPGAKITNRSRDKATVELVEAAISQLEEDCLLSVLDDVEGVDIGLYKRELINTPRGEAAIYTYCGDTEGCVPIKDWKEWQKSSKVKKLRAIKKAGRNAIVLGETYF